MGILGERWGIVPQKHKTALMIDFAKVGKSIFSVQRTNKGGEYPYRITPPHAVGFVLRSGVAPQRCPLSYTAANVSKVLEISKSFGNFFAKKQKVSQRMGHFKTKYNLFPQMGGLTLYAN